MRDRWRQITDKIKRLPILKQILDWSKRTAIPGFSGVPIFNIVVFVYNEAMRDNITTRANAIAFSLFLAIFPAIITLFTLLPLMPFTTDYVSLISDSLETILPTDAHDYLIDLITGITSVNREGLFSLGFILAVFFASSGMLTLMDGFDKTYKKIYKTRSWLRKRFVAINLMLLLSTILILSFVLVIVGNVALDAIVSYFDISRGVDLLLTFSRWMIALLLIYSMITLIYRYGSSMYKRIPFINPGSILATLLSLLTSLLFSYFVNNFGRYNEIYGSIGALIVIMIWIQINAFVILIGYELNASIAVNRNKLSSDMKEVQEALEQEKIEDHRDDV